MTTELLPCAHCGGDPYFRSHGDQALIFCGQCSAELHRCHESPTVRSGDEEVRKAWNARARPALSADAVALAEKLAHRINNSTMLRLTTFEPTRPNGLDEGMLANTILQVLEAFRQQIWAEAIAAAHVVAINYVDEAGNYECDHGPSPTDCTVDQCNMRTGYKIARSILALTPLERKEG